MAQCTSVPGGAGGADDVTYEEKITYNRDRQPGGWPTGSCTTPSSMGKNVIYAQATKLRRRDAGSARHAIEMSIAQFRDCRTCSL
jgi:hypothetical protein